MSASQGTKKVYLSMVDHRTATPGVYRRGNGFRVLTRPDGKRKVMRRFETYEEAVAFKATTPTNQVERKDKRAPRRRRAHLKGDPCAYCGDPSEVIDHIHPRALGGGHDWLNLTAACVPCNAAKRDKPLLIFLAERNGYWQWCQRPS